jgi:hypothetical protein
VPSRDRLTDGLGVCRIVLAALYIGLHVSWRHQLDLMAELDQLPRPMVRGGAGLHTHQAGRLFLEEGQQLGPPQLPAHDHGPRRVNAVDLKNVLRKINTDCDNFVHGRLLFPCG